MNNMTPDNLVTLAHHYSTSVDMRLSWGRIADAVDSGPWDVI